MRKYRKLSLLTQLLLSGCQLAPPYEAPPVCIPEEWKNVEEGEVASVEAEECCEEELVTCDSFWWELFEDPTLNDLEAWALRYNPTVEVAIQRVVEARSLVIVSGAERYPQVTLSPAYTSTGSLFEIYLPATLLPGAPLTKPFRIHQLLYYLPLAVNYEVDLWDRIKNQYDSARYNYQASAYDLQNVMLTLSADLASAYFQLRSLDAQSVVLMNTVRVQKESVELAEMRYKKGLVNLQGLEAAKVQLAENEATYLDALRQRGLAENQIALLIGVPASEFNLEENPLMSEPPAIPPGIPSEVLKRRPDVAAAERNAASEQRLIGVAYASFFPSLSLSGIIGYSSPDMKQFLSWKSRFWQLGANSNESVFDGGRNIGNLDASWARFYEASAQYQQQVLTAFREVEDTLNDLEYRKKQYDRYLEALKASQANTQLSLSRFSKGLVYYAEVIDSENTELQVALNAITTLGQEYLSTVQLIKALGGGWDPEN